MPDGLPHRRGREGTFGVRAGIERRGPFRVRRPRRLRSELVADANPHVRARRARALGERARHPRQELLVGVRVPEPLGELREDLVGRRAFPIHEPVGDPLSASPHRLERQRDDRSGGGGEHRARLTPDQSAPTPTTIAT